MLHMDDIHDINYPSPEIYANEITRTVPKSPSCPSGK